jgi:glycosyltransferase involved in cell wall biosynthesis
LKIAIIRGSNLNPFEMQSYGPLASKYDLTGFAAYDNHYEIDGIPFPVKRLHIAEEYYERLIWPLNSLVYGALLPPGYNYRMFGLEKELAGQDVLHAAETYNGYSYQAARVRKESKKKLVLTVWENIPFQAVRTFKGLTNNSRIVEFVKENTDIFIAITERAKMALMIEGVPEDRIRVVPVGIDTSRFRPAQDPGMREKIGLKDDDLAVLFVGRLTPEKGIYDLLYAAKRMSLDPAMGHVKVIMAGTGPEKENLLRSAKKLGVEGMVRLAGNFSYADIPRLYNAMDAFILPSIPVHFWQEQFGMVLLEAMASGLPVISTMSGSIPEVVGDGGILIQPNDPASIYNEVKRLAGDEAYRRKLGRVAREWAAQEFDVGNISKKIASVYEELS